MPNSDDDELEKRIGPLFICETDGAGQGSGTLYLRPEEHPELAEIVDEVARIRADPRHQHRMMNFQKSLALGDPHAAIADAALPGGAAMWVIRDPIEAPRRLVVLGSADTSDEALALGLATLRLSEVADSDVKGRRVIARWLDKRYTITVDGRVVESGVGQWRVLHTHPERLEPATTRGAERQTDPHS